MRFSTVLLLLTPLVAGASVKEAAKGLPELASAGAGDDFYELGGGSGDFNIAAVQVCPAKYPRKCPLGNFCCKTKKCCKKECCTNDSKYCIKGRCYK
ncbi:hypothetical protein G7Z17_g1396 [Cylindrodendrum hubeiense]|uniref:Uncharacterized protein n=1 Tax=Cylindrodendrum hubeiense TaxID=595255 RepID=A0A9P5LCH8_9HYPO|nr:hypothetical protein G7Z17_g1396 [Cylindrodendrum hubeiense]